MQWFIYKVGAGANLRFLGSIEADDQEAALAAAWAEWPQEIDAYQTQKGFLVRSKQLKGVK